MSLPGPCRMGMGLDGTCQVPAGWGWMGQRVPGLLVQSQAASLSLWKQTRRAIFFIKKAGVCSTQSLTRAELTPLLWRGDDRASAPAGRGGFVQLMGSGRRVQRSANGPAACPCQLSIRDLTRAFDRSCGQTERWKTLSRVFSLQDTQHDEDKGHVRETFLQKMLYMS